jgi:hypothetical protein
MVATTSLSRQGNKKHRKEYRQILNLRIKSLLAVNRTASSQLQHEERKVENAVEDEDVIRCQYNSIWLVADSLQKILKRPTITVNT